MRNFKKFFIGLMCFFSGSAYAGEKENLQKSMAELAKKLTLSDIREIRPNLKPLWQGLKAQTLALEQAPLNTSEELQAAQQQLTAVKVAAKKIEVDKILDVLNMGYNEKAAQIPPAEKAAAQAKLAELGTMLDAAQTEFDITRVNMQLIGVAKKGPACVAQFAVKFYLGAIRQGNNQLMVWWAENQKSEAGIAQLRTIQTTLSEWEPQAASEDKKQLERLHMNLMGLDGKIVYLFLQEP